MMTQFTNQIYSLLRQVPQGRVTTYKALAEAVGTKAYRAVGVAMRNNPYAPQVPCHRVVASDGSLGGFSGQRLGPAIQTKKRLLIKEGVKINGNRIQDFERVFFQPRLK
jgi:methylated-DNA-[protein]-cysteine S-methyltransferase